jgi:mono/diheme cytochrome c family protein
MRLTARKIPHFARNGSSTVWPFVVATVLTGTMACSGPLSRGERLRQGERLFQEQGCVVCHGPHGHGDGPNSRSLNPRPRDFRERSAFLQGTSSRDIAVTLKAGIRVRHAQMPTFSHLSERERLALGEFVVSLQHEK